MTWVVGAATLDIAVLVGDIRITYNAGGRYREESRFGVQKLHAIGPSIATGFAGSIAIGFAMVDDLRSAARSVVGQEPRPEPQDVVNAWRRSVESSYGERFETSLRAAGCHMLIVGASPRWVDGPGGQPLYRVCQAFRVELPLPSERSVHVESVRFNTFDAVGSGASVAAYRDLLNDATADGAQGLLTFAPSAGQGMGNAWHLAGFMTSLGMGTVIERQPVRGISSHLVSAVVTAEGTMFGHNAGADAVVPGTPPIPPLPPLATSQKDLLRLQRRFARSPDAVAIAQT